MMWKVTKKIKRPTTHIAPVRRRNNMWARNDKKKVESFALHLSMIFTPNTETTTNVEDDDIKQTLNAIANVSTYQTL